jgi:hypothetical protein
VAKQEFPTGVGMDLIYEKPHTIFMKIKYLTEEEYYELYPQMKGIPMVYGTTGPGRSE